MEKSIVAQVVVLLIVTGSLGGMFVYTDIYDDVQAKIVETRPAVPIVFLDPKKS